MNQSFGAAILIRIDFNPAGRLQGGSASTPVGTIAEIFAGSPTANIQVAGVIDSGYAFIKVNSINSDTRQPTFITTATVEVYVNGVKYDMAYVNHSQLNETYWNDTSGTQRADSGFNPKFHLLPEKILTRRFKAGLIMYGDLFR